MYDELVTPNSLSSPFFSFHFVESCQIYRLILCSCRPSKMWIYGLFLYNTKYDHVFSVNNRTRYFFVGNCCTLHNYSQPIKWNINRELVPFFSALLFKVSLTESNGKFWEPRYLSSGSESECLHHFRPFCKTLYLLSHTFSDHCMLHQESFNAKC